MTQQLLQNAVYGTVMILAVAALRGTLRDRLLPEARLALWAVCLFRLFTPAAPTSALSFWGLFQREVSAPTVPVTGPAAAPGAGVIASAAPTVGTVPTAPVTPAEAGTGVAWGVILAAVWIAVGAILAARYALAYVRTRRAVGRAIPLGREDARYAALPKCARLREGPMEGAPLTFGVARPTVVLTPGLDGAELACVLAHEGVHARRRDNLWHYAAAAALTVFWWDPAVWLMARLIRRDVELSCDRAAVRRLGEGRRAEYARALVTLSTQAEGGAFCHGFGPKRTEERIISIMKYEKATVTGIALTLALVLAMTVGFASNPGAGIPDEESTTSSTPAPLMWVGSFGPEDELLKFTIGLDYLETLLAESVNDGIVNRDAADYYLTAAKCASQDGVKLEWTVPENIRLFVDKGSMEMTFNIYYKDKDGNKVYLNPVEMFADYIFPPDEYAGLPRAEDGEPDANADDWDEAPDCTREDCPIQPSIHFHNEDGSVSYISNDLPVYVDIEVCAVEGCTIQGEHFHHDPLVEDSAGDTGGPIGCPPESIDQDFYQKYPEANYQNFGHHNDGHHSDSHH